MSDASAGVGIGDFAEVLDAVPPGVDELVALAKVVSLARRDALGVHFERVVIDTAPTGHTLRLLTFPEFLDNFIERALTLRRRFQGATAVVDGAKDLLGRVLGNAPPPPPDMSEQPAVVALGEFQDQMKELQESILLSGVTLTHRMKP